MYRLFCSTKEGFSPRKGIKQGVKKFARLTPIKRKVLIPIKDTVSGTVGKIIDKPSYITGKVTSAKPRSIFKNDPTPRSKPKKSVRWHPALITGALVGAAGGVGSGELYNRAKRGDFVKRYEVYNPITKRYEARTI